EVVGDLDQHSGLLGGCALDLGQAPVLVGELAGASDTVDVDRDALNALRRGQRRRGFRCWVVAQPGGGQDRTSRGTDQQTRGEDETAVHATPPKSRTSWARRLAAISQYRSSSSMPMALRPRSFAARSVVPE